VEAASAEVELEVMGVTAKRVRVTEYRMDRDHSNAYSAWLKMGSPQTPTAGQVEELKKASELAVLRESKLGVKAGAVEWKSTLPRQAVSLVHIAWD